MLQDGVFLSAFGLILLASAFLIWIWGQILRGQAMPGAAPDRRYRMLAQALFLHACASLLLFATRAADNLWRGYWTSPPYWDGRTAVLLAGTLLLLIAKVTLIRVSDIGKARRKQLFPWFLAISTLWVVGSAVGMILGFIPRG